MPFTTSGSPFARKLLTVAWMSLLLGLVIELSLVVIAAEFGTADDPRPFIADAAQRVSWSLLVCMGLTLGTASAPATRAAAMGIYGLLSAPLAFVIARAVHRAASLGLGVPLSPGLSPLVVATIRALEFACLGVAAAWLASKPWGGIRAHALIGLTMGLLFGGPLLAYAMATTTASPVKLVGLAANEVLYPVGCAIVLFVAGSLGARMAEADRLGAAALAAG
jgi:hypothetical protein